MLYYQLYYQSLWLKFVLFWKIQTEVYVGGACGH